MNNIDAVRQRMESIIKRVGWMVQGVFPTRESPGPSFCYSIGLHDKGLPELLVFGLPMEVGTELINDIAGSLLAKPDEELSLRGRFEHPKWPMPFELRQVSVNAAEQYAFGASRRSAGQATYLQIVWPDRNGRFPEEPGVSEGYLKAQPILQ